MDNMKYDETTPVIQNAAVIPTKGRDPLRRKGCSWEISRRCAFLDMTAVLF